MRVCRDVDLIDLLRAGTLLRMQIVERGRLLIARDRDVILDFEARVLSDYSTHQDSTRAA